MGAGPKLPRSSWRRPAQRALRGSRSAPRPVRQQTSIASFLPPVVAAEPLIVIYATLLSCSRLAAGYFCAAHFRPARYRSCTSLSCLFEIAQVRRRLVLLGGHQEPVTGKEIIFVAVPSVIAGLMAF